jgi:hypothetical protein
MDYLAYLIARKDLADCPIIDETVPLLFGKKDKTTMSVTERRSALKRRNR